MDISKKRRKKDSVANYSQLIVPEKMKSHYWEYFGFPADETGNVISKERVVCTICTTQVSYCANTSNLRSHLKTRHKDVFEELEHKIIKTQPIKLIKVEHLDEHGEKFFEEVDFDPAQYEEVDVTEEEESIKLLEDPIAEQEIIPKSLGIEDTDGVTLNLLMKMVISDLIPLETVQGYGFITFFKHFTKSSNTQLPDVISLNEAILNYYNQLVGKFNTVVKQTVRNNNFSLCFEKFECCERNSFITISANVLLANYELQNIVLDVVGKVDWKIWFQKHDYLKMYDNCVAAVMNYEDLKLKEFFAENTRGIPIIPCLATRLELAIEEVLSIETLADNLDLILEEFKHHFKDTNRSEHWLSKYNDISDLKDKIDKYTIEASPDILNILTQFIDCVNPVKTCLELLFDVLPSASLIMPLIKEVINRHLSGSEEHDLRNSMKQILNNIFPSDEITSNMLSIATFLDPRFKNTEDNFKIDVIKSLLKADIEKATQGDKSLIIEKAEDPVKRDNKHKRLSFIFNSKVIATHSSSKSLALPKFDTEFLKYINANEIGIEKCPAEWWLNNSYMFEHLRTLSLRYFCVPHSSHFRFKLSFKEQMDFRNKRYGLTGSLIPKLILLHHNKDIFEGLE